MTNFFSAVKFCIPFLFYSLFILKTQAQCAGRSNLVTICNKELDSSLQNYNLFNQLLGKPKPGGLWTSPNPVNDKALNKKSGILNLWLINTFGEHSFTYTNSSCDETATITINLGGYAGEDNIGGGANACSDNTSVNLYSFLDNDLENLNADINGVWESKDKKISGFLNKQFFDATKAGPGIYRFTYTVNALDTCSSEFSTIELEVSRSNNAGVVKKIIICEDEDFSPYTAVNLYDQIVGEDSGGVWSEDRTNQITSLTDSEINIKEIYDKYGAGDYKFTYTLSPTHGVCNEKFVDVIVSIINFYGQFKVKDICKGDALKIDIDYNNYSEVFFKHDLKYEIVNTLTGDTVYKGIEKNIKRGTGAEFVDRYSFTLFPSLNLDTGKYEIKFKSVSNVSGLICSSLKIRNTSFIVRDTRLSINENKECFNDENVLINIENLVDIKGKLSNTNYRATYTVRDITNDITKEFKDKEIKFTNGATVLPIDISIFPKNAREYNLKFTEAIGNTFNCIDFVFKAALVPKKIKFNLELDDKCDTENITLTVEAPDLGDGNYTVNYEVKKKGTTNILLNKTFVLEGKVDERINENINVATLSMGNYEIVLKSTQTDTNPCKINSEFKIKKEFSIGGVPDAPELEENQFFCSSNFSSDKPTIADIKIDKGVDLVWYSDFDTTEELPLSTLLVHGEDYFVLALSDTENNCNNSSRSIVNIIITEPSPVKYSNNEPVFCDSGIFTLNDLDATATSGNLLWYDSLIGGNLLPSTSVLENGKSYFAVEKIGDCEFSSRLGFTVTMNEPLAIVSEELNPVFCNSDIFTLKDLDATATSGEVLWYDSLIGGNLLPTNTMLENRKSYFAVEKIGDCEFNERLKFSVTKKEIPKPEYVGANLLCGLDKLTLEKIEEGIVPNSNFELSWYDALKKGTEIDNYELVNRDTSYFVAFWDTETGCESERVLVRLLLSECDPDTYNFFIPDGFSPNQDGVNDTYYIPKIEFFYPNYVLEIFDRHGQSIFTLNKNTPSWNGYHKKSGKDANVGVYFYTLQFNKNNLKPVQGRLYLSK